MPPPRAAAACLLGQPWKFSAWMMKTDFIPSRWRKYLEEITLTRYEYYGMSKWRDSFAARPRQPAACAPCGCGVR